jgi:Ca2+-binding RTX toxin-like protein
MFNRFPRRTKSAADRRKSQSNRFSFESLERREMMAGDMGIKVIGGEKLLVIDGTGGADKATVVADGAFHVKATLNGKSERFALVNFDKILFKGYDGNDTFDNDSSRVAEAYGHAGNDKLYGGPAGDLLNGGSGNDHLDGAGGNDRLVGGPDELVKNTTDNDSLLGGTGDDVLVGGAGDDSLNGEGGDDRYVFNGKTLGHDKIFGTAGVNTIDFRGRTGSNVLDLSLTHKQTVRSGQLSLTLESAASIDDVFGSDYDDTFVGNALANRLFGNGGNDRITGGLGADELNGGAGNDVFPELRKASWDVWFSAPGFSRGGYETQRVFATKGYDVVGSTWSVSNSIRATSGQLTSTNYVDVYAFLSPEQFGAGRARVDGTLTLEMMPDGDKLVK